MAEGIPERAELDERGRIVYDEPPEPSIWTGGFWKATAERVISTGAQAGLLAIGADQFSALDVDWRDVLGFIAGGAALALLKSLAVNAVTKTGPGFTQAEQVIEQQQPVE